MTNLTHQGVEEVVGRLTKAQREALTSKGYPIPSMGPSGYDSVIIGFEHGRSAKALHRLGLANLPFAPQILTPLGLAVRAHLLGQSNGEKA